MSIRLPLTLSAAGHAVCLALLLLFLSDEPTPVPKPIAKGGIEVVFQPPLPMSEAAPLPQPAVQPETLPPPAETQTEVVPPAPEPAVAAAEPLPPLPEPPAIVTESRPPAPEAPVVATEATPPLPKPASKKPPKPVKRQQEMSQPYLPSPPAQPPSTPVAPPLTASAATPVPAPVDSPEASAGYRALLSAWLESHKRYPDGARQRGEEGNAVLRFAVDRNGRVIDYAVTRSSGYPDLDESIEQMMHGAALPPFPANVPEPRMEVSVTIRFSLRR